MKFYLLLFVMLAFNTYAQDEYSDLDNICGIPLKNPITYFSKTESAQKGDKGNSHVTTYRIKNKAKPNYIGWLDIYQYESPVFHNGREITNSSLPTHTWESKNKFTPASELFTNFFMEPPAMLYRIGTTSNGQMFIYNVHVKLFISDKCMAHFDIMSTYERADIYAYFKGVQAELKENSKISFYDFKDERHQWDIPKLKRYLALAGFFFLALFFASFILLKKFIKKNRKPNPTLTP